MVNETMARRRWARGAGAVLASALVLPLAVSGASADTDPPPEDSEFSALVFSHTEGFRHGSIEAGVAAIQQLGAENNFSVDHTENSADFTEENLADYDVVVWLSTTGDVLNDEQQAAFEQYIQSGGGYAGIHAASDTEYDWAWYGDLVGAYFSGHPAQQDATVDVVDQVHPSTEHLPYEWERFDEWYSFEESPRGDVHVLATLDEETYNPDGNEMGDDHPIAWCQDYDGGRSWYTGGGHTEESFADDAFLQHVLGGLRTAAGVEDADCTATVESSYQKVTLVQGEENVGEPMALAVLPNGDVLHTARDGRIFYTGANGGTSLAAEVPVYSHDEDGMQGIAVDPNFAENRWVYAYYAPPLDTPEGDAPESGEPEDFAPFDGYNQLSRFQLSEDGTLDLDSEQEILQVEADRGVCCHAGGEIDFDGEGNLWLSTGDDTNPFASDGYTPIDEREDRNPAWDAQRSSANTNDLRGKLLRVSVNEDGSYDIPEGNLFEPGTEQTRPEIYAMGFRNPFRFAVDDETGWVHLGDYGPDAGGPNPDRGPGGQVEFNLIKEPGNYGWPYCHGANDAYIDYDFGTEESGAAFDCDNPVNESPNNTGLTELPPAVPAWLPYDGGSVPALGSGSESPMGGPTYHYDPELDSDTKWPEYWDGKTLNYEWGRDWIREFVIDDEGGLVDIVPSLDWLNPSTPMALEFGPDGALYVLDYGSGGYFAGAWDSAVYRVDYVGDSPNPVATITTSTTNGQPPLSVEFDGTGSTDPQGMELSYAWDFDNDGEIDSTEPTADFTYETAGVYTARLTVSAGEGEDVRTGTTTTNIFVGNTAPEVTLELPANGGIFSFGDEVPYRVNVTDAEDGEIDCSDVQVEYILGHDEHGHPLSSSTGCEGTIDTPADDGHGLDANVFGVINASYTDEGAEDLPNLSDDAEAVLRLRNQQAEFYTDAEGVNVMDKDGALGGSQVGDIHHGDWIAFDPMDLTNIDEVSFRFSSAGAGGTVELRKGAVDGELIATAEVGSTGDWETWDVSERAEVSPVGGPEPVYFVFVNDAAGDEALFDIDEIQFHGLGMSGEAPGPDPEEPVCEDPDAEIPASDEFDGDDVDPCRWEVIDRDDDLLDVSDGAVHITTTDNDIYGTDNSTVPNILRSTQVEGDQWTVETKVTGALESTYQQGGIIVYGDADNYVKLDAVSGGGDAFRVELRSEVGGEIQDPQDDINDLTQSEDQTFYLRLTRDGDTFTGAYSPDGETWTDTPSAVANAAVGHAGPGIFALGAQQVEPTTLSFDYFHLVGEDVPTEPIHVPVEQVSVQMFSLIPWVNEVGLDSVLARLAEIGLENIEPFGGNFGGYSAEEFRAMVDELGLSVPSSHYNTDEDSFDETLAYVETLGQEYVGSGGFASPGIGSYDDTLATAATMDRLGERSVEAEIGKFFGHNHAGEFTTTYEHDGEELSAWEILVAETNPEHVTFQLDVAWAAHAGVDVPALIEEHGDRIELLHIKDATGLVEDDRPTFTNLGEGDVDLQGILAAARDHADIAYYVLEYDVAPEGNDFVTTGFEYLTGQDAGEAGSRTLEATPEAVTFTDEDHAYTIPRVTGVNYLIDGEVVEAGTYDGAGTVTVTAEAAAGFELAEGATTEWSHTFAPIHIPVEQVSIQMYSLTEWVDDIGLQPVLARLAEIGFENIEPYGGNFGDYTAEEFRAMVDELGLSVPSSHYNTDEDSFDETLAYVETLGQEYVGSGGFADPGFDSYEDTLATAETMNRLGERSVEAGIGKFFGHNHAGEFTTTYEHDGEELSVWEILVAETNPEHVTFQLDVAWAAHAGVDVPALIEEHGDRIELLHIKDATGLVEDDGPTFTNLGEGDVDLQGILVAAEKYADIAYYVLEYDRAPDGDDFVTTGFEYITGLDAGGPEPVVVTPEAVTFDDRPGFASDTFTVPEVEGVEYLIGDDVIDAGTYAGVDTVTVTAQAADGYQLADGADTEWSHTFSTEVPGPDRRTAEFHLSNDWRGSTDVFFMYGRWADEVLIGDWDGDGHDTIAVRRGDVFHVSNAHQGGDADAVFSYGRPGDVILVGDWNGDGTDAFAVRRGAEYHVKNSLSGGDADVVFTYGRADDAVMVGDWNADDVDTFAVRRGATYHVKNSLRGGDADVVFTYGRPGDFTLAGDWNGDGVDTFAVRRGATYHVNDSLRGGDADRVVTFGREGDEVYVGDWNDDGIDTLGIRRPVGGHTADVTSAVTDKEVRTLAKVS